MPVYSIKDLEKLSGIKAHTIRIWEKRYDLLQPKRTKTNIRYYLDDDLQFILKVAFLKKNGFKISKIAAMDPDQVVAEVEAMMNVKETMDGQHDALTLSVLELDRFKVEQILNYKIEQLGFEETLFEVIYPLLEKINLLWITGSFEQFHENFLIQVIRQKLIKEIDGFSRSSLQNAPKVLLFSNEGAEELSLLLSDYYFRKVGFNTINLGSGIEKKDIKNVYQRCPEPNYILLLVNHTESKAASRELIEEIITVYTEPKLLVSGYFPDTSQYKENIHVVKNVLEIKEFALERIKEADTE